MGANKYCGRHRGMKDGRATCTAHDLRAEHGGSNRRRAAAPGAQTTTPGDGMREPPADETRRTERTGGTVLPISILPFPALRLDQNGVVIESNGELERELGIAPSALVSRRFADCVAEHSRADV